MTDEAFHHKFGKIWADRTVPKLTESRAQHRRGLGRPLRPVAAVQPRIADQQQASIYQRVRPRSRARDRRHRQAPRQRDKDPNRRFRGETNIFRVLIKTLLNSGLITERTRGFYATYVDMDELKAEGERMLGDDIAEEGINYLQAINFKDRAKVELVAAE